jgi:hypothetical protein
MNKVITIPDNEIAAMKKEAVDLDFKSFKQYLEYLVESGRDRVLVQRNLKKKSR